MRLQQGLKKAMIRVRTEKLQQIFVILAVVFGLTTLVILFASPGGICFPLALGAALLFSDFPSTVQKASNEQE